MIIHFVEQVALDLGRLEGVFLGRKRKSLRKRCIHDTSYEKDRKLGLRRGELFTWFSSAYSTGLMA